MLNVRLAVAAATALLAQAANAQQRRDFTPYMISDRWIEMALARSAAPAAVSDSATVLVLTHTGYVEGSRGHNGVTCLVLRSFAASVGDPNFWNSKVRAPLCLTAPAVRTVLPGMIKRAEWVLAGVAPAEIATRTSRAYASHEFPSPGAGAMAYMTSSKQYLQDDAPHNWVPHVMFFYDRSVPASTWGVAGDSATVFDAAAGDTTAAVHVVLIPVRRWSDGSIVTQAANHK